MRPAIIVDGQMEQRIVQQICPGLPVRLLNCNGKCVEVEAIVKRVASHQRLLKCCFPVVVVIDREERIPSAEDFRDEIVAGLGVECPGIDIRVVVCDRMTENWMLADAASLGNGEFDINKVPVETEGIHGKNAIGRCLPDGRRYHETTDGVDMFLKCRPERISRRSASFRNLISALEGIPCDWLIESR